MKLLIFNLNKKEIKKICNNYMIEEILDIKEKISSLICIF